jgi:hypothetical protein
LEFHPYPLGVEALDHDPRHLTSGVWFADGWNAFPAGYPSFKEKGAVFWAGNIRLALPEPNCDPEKSGPVARGRQGVPSAYIIRGSARFAECGLRAWPMGPAPPPPASRCGRPPHPTARFEGHVMRRNHPPVRRLSCRQRISCLKQVSAPTSFALVGVSVLAGPIIMFCDVKQV